MNFIQKIVGWIEYGNYTPVKKYGTIYSETIGKEQFTLAPQLLQGEKDWVLRLDLNRHWGNANSNRTLIDCHFRALNEISKPIQQMLNDVQAGVTQPDLALKTGFIEKFLLNMAAGKIIRSYGRIDHHPKKEGRFRIEVFLSWDGRRYWLLLREWEGSGEWSKWPVGLAVKLTHLLSDVEAIIRASGKNKPAAGK